MTPRFSWLTLLALLSAACEVGGRPPSFVIPGPAVPSPLPTTGTYVWDTDDELSIWMRNPVARGSLALEGSGTAAFIRIDQADLQWVVRSPDLTPPAAGVHTVRIRYRWRPDPGLPSTAARSAPVGAFFQTSAPAIRYDPTAQAAAWGDLMPVNDWTDVALIPSQFTPPIAVEYFYLHSLGANRGVLEIDRIELVR